MDEIIRQARQGSMAALIQLMNERLADSGIRTRATFDDGLGVLQILCEAETPEQLEQAYLVPRLTSILQELSPRNFRRIRINARITREQQLLWLDEIKREPENQLLWSEDIQLTPPNLWQQMLRRFQDRQSAVNTKQKVDKSLLEKRSRLNPYWKGVGGGVLLCLLVLGGFWSWWRWRSAIEPSARAPLKANSIPEASRVVQNTEPFAEAVRLAEASAANGQTAKTAAEWLDLAAKWQRASDLMQSVAKSDPRYSTARSRAQLYRKNSEMAQQQARRLQ
ncbi:hypothetical protein [Oscillatoria sp. FACHB-1406]|uniref:hypothetical protein n=1 Tax=Oscillatoria sp. FACHB-1406 TaxID=2692846 RepID=UPI0016844A05|nr:hypothetical protein [Oscillatoria sp. FACHB-1406]MBD2580556.1 hypothetical protein [Oscillatoria sp. FACHB-1406]